MEIIWHGLSFFQINGKRDGEKIGLVINPFSKESTPGPLKIKADITIFSSPVPFSNIKNIENLIPSTFLIEGPGEYEVKGVKIKGMSDFSGKLGEKNIARNAIFKIEFEGIKICHLGNFNDTQVSSEILEKILGIDILFIPIGGDFTISGKEAAKLVSQVEPKIVIPMNYLPSDKRDFFKIKGLKLKLGDEKDFLKSLGIKAKEKIKKLKMKTDELQGNGTELILLELT